MRRPVNLGGLAEFSAKSRIELRGNREAVVEGCCGILEYAEGVVRLRMRERTVRFTGRGLSIRCMTADSLVVTGYILQIEFME